MRNAARRVFVVLPTLILLCVSLAGCGARLVGDEPSGGGREAAVAVSRVTDGDTARVAPGVDGEERVRLIGVDAPEIGQSPSEPYAEEAKDFARENLEGREVTLEFDVEERDDYGRLLAYVYLPDGSMFDETLLSEGYAQVATFPPNTRHLDRFEEAQNEAREAGRGLWSLPEGELCRLRDRGNGIGGGCG